MLVSSAIAPWIQRAHVAVDIVIGADKRVVIVAGLRVCIDPEDIALRAHYLDARAFKDLLPAGVVLADMLAGSIGHRIDLVAVPALQFPSSVHAGEGSLGAGQSYEQDCGGARELANELPPGIGHLHIISLPARSRGTTTGIETRGALRGTTGAVELIGQRNYVTILQGTQGLFRFGL